MLAVIDNLKAAVEFIKEFFNYILSFFTNFGGGNADSGAEDTTV